MSIEQASALLASARSALFITGAGVSAASGIPTYRGIGGLYGDKATDEGLAIEDALSGGMFQRRPEVTWKYIHQIERACRGARFNAAHAALARLERRIARCWVLTQNVDGFHRIAGSTNVIDIHGDIRHVLCTRCAYEAHVDDYAALAPCPRCPECAAVLRPDVVLFGEMLPLEKVEVLRRELARGFDVVVSIGTSSLFPYITGPVLEAARSGVPTLEINPEPTTISTAVAVRLPMRAVEALEGILSRIEPSG
ncbi:NAD-dependent deacylase [Sorangium sp. So ce1014]|uniref:NAD-dependent deacylase n=1 Tax=Sorangium sp. So ce1014 TaxID=3133326 RepID=UPI003F612063